MLLIGSSALWSFDENWNISSDLFRCDQADTKHSHVARMHTKLGSQTDLNSVKWTFSASQWTSACEIIRTAMTLVWVLQHEISTYWFSTNTVSHGNKFNFNIKRISLHTRHVPNKNIKIIKLIKRSELLKTTYFNRSISERRLLEAPRDVPMTGTWSRKYCRNTRLDGKLLTHPTQLPCLCLSILRARLIFGRSLFRSNCVYLS